MTPEVGHPEGWRPRPAHRTQGEGLGRSRPADKLSLKAFWEAVEARLGASSLEDLRTVLRAMASRVHPSGRQSFLQSLAPVPDAGQEALEHALQDKLLADVTEQAQRLAEFMDEVRGQHRRSYGKAALVLAACAEVLRMREQPERAQELLRRFRGEFPRHSAFQAELDAAVHRR